MNNVCKDISDKFQSVKVMVVSTVFYAIENYVSLTLCTEMVVSLNTAMVIIIPKTLTFRDNRFKFFFYYNTFLFKICKHQHTLQ